MNRISTIIYTLLLFVSITVAGQDRLFTFTYQSPVLNKGSREIEVWNTFRTGREDYYARLDNRTEFEIGLGSHLQTSFYLNLTSKTATQKIEGINSLETEQELGFSNEWKLNILDPVSHPFGLALYGEYGIMSNEYEFEGKVILDKMAGDFTFAINGVYEKELVPVIEDNENRMEQETKAEYLFAIAYAVGSSFHLTLENSLKNVYEEGELQHSALYSGPGLSFTSDKFWLNFTVMPQLTSFKGDPDHSINLQEFEKLQIRLLFSYEL